jgi:hypothetical protein
MAPNMLLLLYGVTKVPQIQIETINKFNINLWRTRAMNQKIERPSNINLHLTNVAGAGAMQLLQSLLPYLENDPKFRIKKIFLPNRGSLSNYSSACSETTTKVYRRYLPNSLSRVLECTLLGNRFDKGTPLLVLGDIPLRMKGTQIVFVQTYHIFRPESYSWKLEDLKFFIMRLIFRSNLVYAKKFIVQTDYMRNQLSKFYPEIKNNIHVIGQPVPTWLINANLKRTGPRESISNNLKLVYPAAKYAHKNHGLLSKIDVLDSKSWPIETLTLTINQNVNAGRIL